MSVEIIAELKELMLNGMATCYPELLAKARHSEFVPDTFMRQLIEAETAERTVRSMAYQMGAARFPTHRDLAGFDFSAAQVDEALVRELHQAKCIDTAQHVVLIGGPGTGKTHLATAIGVEALRTHAKRVRFFSTVELVNALELEKATGRAGQIANRLMHVDLVILDEVGYLPFSQAGGALLFHLLSKLYERTSVIITTNLSFSGWSGMLFSVILTGMASPAGSDSFPLRFEHLGDKSLGEVTAM